jgi:hypothetical protein
MADAEATLGLWANASHGSTSRVLGGRQCFTLFVGNTHEILLYVAEWALNIPQPIWRL